jgi:hypothetical protein
MTYLSISDIRDFSDTKRLELDVEKRITDEVLSALIFSVSQWVNSQLNADKEKNLAGNYVFIDFQISDVNGDSYCVATQLTQIENIVLYEIVARALVIKQKNTQTPKVIQINPQNPIWADDSYDDVKRSKDYHEAVITMINNLLVEDEQYGNFKYARQDTEGEGYGFVKVNADELGRHWLNCSASDVAKRFT